MNRDLYDILELKKNCTQEEIKKNYKKLSLKYHPDRNNNPNENIKMQEINNAYQILSDPVKRRQYDLLGDETQFEFNDFVNSFNMDDFKNSMFEEMFKQNNEFFNRDSINEIINQLMKNVIKKFFESKKDVLTETDYSDSESEIRQYLKVNVKKYDLYLTLECTIEEMYNRKKKKIVYEIDEYDQNNDKIKVSKSIVVNLYSDVSTYNEKGHAYFDDSNEKQYGNLVVKIKCLKDKKFKRIGNNAIAYIKPINMYELFNGVSFNLVLPDNNEISFNYANIFDYNFDGSYAKNEICDLGLPLDDMTRSNLLILLYLVKPDDFNIKLSKFYK